MLGFGKRRLPLQSAVGAWLTQSVDDVDKCVRAVQAAFAQALADEDDPHLVLPTTDEIFVETLPAALVVGLQPLRNLWDHDMYDRGRRSLADALDLNLPVQERDRVKIRVIEYFEVWEKWQVDATGNAPWDDIAASVLERLGVPYTVHIGGMKFINPTSILWVSGKLMEFGGPFWKQLRDTYKVV